MEEETRYTISQLADLAGVTPRTIRYYTAEGLLPRPDARGQYALYGEEHLLRLRLIGRLKQAYLPLGEIKARIDHLDSQQLRLLLEEYGDPPAPASATDYLAHVRARQQLPPAPQRLAEQAEPYAAMGSPVLGLRSPGMPDAPADPAPIAPVYGFAASLPAPAAEPRPEKLPQQPGLLRKLIPARRNADAIDSPRAEAAPAPEPAEAEQRWRRIALAPGVELHVREPTVTPLRERIEQLIALARTLFESRD